MDDSENYPEIPSPSIADPEPDYMSNYNKPEPNSGRQLYKCYRQDDVVCISEHQVAANFHRLSHSDVHTSAKESKNSLGSKTEIISLEAEPNSSIEKCIQFWHKIMQENLEPVKCTIINDKRGKKKRKSTSQEESEELEKLRNAVTSLQESENKLKQIFLNAVKEIQQKKLDQIKLQAKRKCPQCKIMKGKLTKAKCCTSKLDDLVGLNDWKTDKKSSKTDIWKLTEMSENRVIPDGPDILELIKKKEKEGKYSDWNKPDRERCECNQLPDCACNHWNVIARESFKCVQEEPPVEQEEVKVEEEEETEYREMPQNKFAGLAEFLQTLRESNVQVEPVDNIKSIEEEKDISLDDDAKSFDEVLPGEERNMSLEEKQYRGFSCDQGEEICNEINDMMEEVFREVETCQTRKDERGISCDTEEGFLMIPPKQGSTSDTSSYYQKVEDKSVASADSRATNRPIPHHAFDDANVDTIYQTKKNVTMVEEISLGPKDSVQSVKKTKSIIKSGTSAKNLNPLKLEVECVCGKENCDCPKSLVSIQHSASGTDIPVANVDNRGRTISNTRCSLEIYTKSMGELPKNRGSIGSQQSSRKTKSEVTTTTRMINASFVIGDKHLYITPPQIEDDTIPQPTIKGGSLTSHRPSIELPAYKILKQSSRTDRPKKSLTDDEYVDGKTSGSRHVSLTEERNSIKIFNVNIKKSGSPKLKDWVKEKVPDKLPDSLREEVFRKASFGSKSFPTYRKETFSDTTIETLKKDEYYTTTFAYVAAANSEMLIMPDKYYKNVKTNEKGNPALCVCGFQDCSCCPPDEDKPLPPASIKHVKDTKKAVEQKIIVCKCGHNDCACTRSETELRKTLKSTEKLTKTYVAAKKPSAEAVQVFHASMEYNKVKNSTKNKPTKGKVVKKSIPKKQTVPKCGKNNTNYFLADDTKSMHFVSLNTSTNKSSGNRSSERERRYIKVNPLKDTLKKIKGEPTKASKISDIEE